MDIKQIAAAMPKAENPYPYFDPDKLSVAYKDIPLSFAHIQTIENKAYSHALNAQCLRLAKHDYRPVPGEVDISNKLDELDGLCKDEDDRNMSKAKLIRRWFLEKE